MKNETDTGIRPQDTPKPSWVKWMRRRYDSWYAMQSPLRKIVFVIASVLWVSGFLWLTYLFTHPPIRDFGIVIAMFVLGSSCYILCPL